MAGLANFKGKKAAPFVKGGKRRRAKAVLAEAKERKGAADRDKDADDLATGLSGREIDLDWSAWNKAHRGQKTTPGAQRARAAVRTGVIAPKEIRSFKKMAGLKGGYGLGAKAQTALQNRAAQPNHFRAKAILAAQSGNLKAARKFQALHVQRMASIRRARTGVGSAGAAAVRPPTPKVAAPRPPATPRPRAIPAPRSPAVKPPRVTQNASNTINTHPSKALRRAVADHQGQVKIARTRNQNKLRAMRSLSSPVDGSLDLSTLTAAERNALPASAFVFPKKRAYPIHDKAHAANALARSKGKKEHAAVVAAVKSRYGMM